LAENICTLVYEEASPAIVEAFVRIGNDVIETERRRV
jgi:hypothetical protein